MQDDTPRDEYARRTVLLPQSQRTRQQDGGDRQ